MEGHPAGQCTGQCGGEVKLARYEKTSFFFLALSVSALLAAQDAVKYGSNEKVGRYLEVNDIKVYYEVYGEGEPLLLIHGGLGSIEAYTYQIPAFSKDLKVIAGMDGPAPYFAIAYLVFKTMDQFQASLAAHGKTLTDDMPNYTRDVIIQISEIVKL